MGEVIQIAFATDMSTYFKLLKYTTIPSPERIDRIYANRSSINNENI